MAVNEQSPLGIDQGSLGTSSIKLKEFQASDVVGLSNGGTGVSSLVDLSALLNLSAFAGESSDHGELAGLGDNDHPQYTLSSTNSTLSSLVTTNQGLMESASSTVFDNSAVWETVAALNDIKNNGQLMARKTSNQTTTTSWVTLTAFTNVDVSGGDVAFTIVTGVVDINTAGLYRIGYNILGENTANGRAGLESKLQVDTGGGGGYVDLPQSISGSYARLDAAQDFATNSCEAYLRECTASDSFILQVQHTTTALTVTGYISIERLN